MSRAPMRTDGTKARNLDVQSPNAPARANAQRLRAETWAGGTKAMDAPVHGLASPEFALNFFCGYFVFPRNWTLDFARNREEPPERHWQ